MNIEFDISLESRHMVTMHLIGEGPKDSFPNQTGLSILKSDVVFVVGSLGCNEKVEIGNVYPE